MSSTDTPAETGTLAPLRALAGAISAAMALAIGELFDGFSTEIPSLVISAGDWVIDVAPGQVERSAIDTLGTADKPALVIGTVILTLLIGALMGKFSSRHKAVAPTVFTVFGLIGWWFLARNPLATSGINWLVALVAAAGGFATFKVLTAALAPRTAKRFDPTQGGIIETPIESPAAAHASRRSFFGWAGAAGAGALAFTGLGRMLRNRGNFDQARDAIEINSATDVAEVSASIENFDNIEGLSSYITDNSGSNFYRIDSALTIPQINPDDWSLKITGMVDNPIEFTLADLQSMEQVDQTVTISCVSNPVGGELVGNAVWTGIPLTRLLEIAQVQEGATQLVGKSADGWTAGFPPSVLDDGRSALLAIGMNGIPLPERHGFPARLVIAGLYGYVSATKWITEINMTTWEDFDGYWIPRGWSKEGPIKTTSRIDVPSHASELPQGTQTVAGVAWAPTRGLSKVEVRIDDGEWQEAQLAEAVSNETWVQWKLDWDAPVGDHVIRVRAYDGNGDIQPEGPKRVDPDGAEGWHAVVVRIA